MKGDIQVKMINREAVIKKIIDMPQERVAKVLIFMAGMEAEHRIHEQKTRKEPHKPPKQTSWFI